LVASQVMRGISADELARARQLVEDGEQRVAAQNELVEQLKAGGDRASSAQEIILRTMKDALYQLRQQLREASDRT
jgi:hypothetical protein